VDARPPAPAAIRPIAAPTLAGVKPQAPAATPTLEPYRVLFPIGAALGVAGALVWALHAAGFAAWPGRLHAALMIEGFELSFVTGFLLTAMPAFTHGARCRPWELGVAVAGVLAFAAARAAGAEGAAHAFFALALAFVAVTLARRVRFGAAAPPEEFALVGAGLLMGVAGGAMQALAAAGAWPEPSLHLGLRAISRGMVLALVLGLGGLLVPAFALVPEPLRIVGVARAGQRGPRHAFIAGVALLIVAALVAEAFARPVLAAWLRLAAGAASTLLAWKLWRLPGRRDVLPWALWSAGVCVLAGLGAAAVWPAHEIAAWHVVFVGGYGLLTMSIATRVVVSHGGHALREERVLLGAPALACLGLALVARVAGGEVDPRLATALAVAGIAWAMAWSLWLAAALPRVRRTRHALMMPGPAAGHP
jgi:uncharacterized protein involved in response to NO